MDPNAAWSPKPRLPGGDPYPDMLYHAMGHALHCWALFEGITTHTFAYLMGNEHMEEAALAYRAAGSTAVQRAMFEAVLSSHKHANAPYAQPIKDVLDRMNKLQARRNDIAHGYVSNVNNLGCYLMPPPSSPKSRKGDPTFGAYAYTAAQVQEYAAEFIKLHKDMHTQFGVIGDIEAKAWHAKHGKSD